MFDDRNDSATDWSVVNQLDRPQRRIYEYVREHGPIGRPSLQADLYPYDRQTFETALEYLVKNGYICLDGVTVSLELDRPVLASNWTVYISGLDGPVTYRPATESDIPGLLGLIENIEHHEHQDSLPELVDRLRADESAHTPFPREGMFVAEHDGQVRGWAHVAGPPSEGEADVDGGVADSVRRNGLGSHFHRYVVDWLEASGYDRAYYHVPAADAETFQFLRARGWAVEGVRPGQDDTTGEQLRLAYELDDEQE